MKSRLVWVVIVLLIALLIASCSPKSVGVPTSSPAQVAQPTQTPDQQRKNMSAPTSSTASPSATTSSPPAPASVSVITTPPPAATTSPATTVPPLTATTSPPPLETASPLSDGSIGIPYSHTLVSSNGNYYWSLASGSLPPGLSLDTSVPAITGTPLATGTFEFSLNVTGPVSEIVRTTRIVLLSITVNAAPVITTASLSSGNVGASYFDVLTASGGSKSYTWSLAGGALPPGLSMSEWGIITGTPATAGKFNITAKVTDDTGASAAIPLSISIDVALPEKV